ncbi:MAG: hypothetical protein IPJ65_38245 [Archangiaceae bacterium]|nr:hypothetical protein [Archangiaceae bacterium]
MTIKLKAYTRPDSFIGQTWEGWLVAPCGQNRDSVALTRSNFTVQNEALRKGAEINEDFEIVRERHWAVGWIEWVAIRPGTPAEKIALELAQSLEGYPVLDEDHWCNLEHDEADAYWNSMSVSNRLEVLRRAHYRGSCLAARHDYPPSDDTGYIQEILTGA